MTLPPSGTVTFLLAAVEDSAQQWEQYPDAVRSALDRQRRLLQDAIERCRGHLVQVANDQVGPETIWAAFETAADGLAAAIAGQRALVDEPAQAGGTQHVRMALHTGAVEARAGGYVGTSIHRVASLLATGHGGQILLSQPTVDLVRDDLAPGISLRDLGEHRLKDLIR